MTSPGGVNLATAYVTLIPTAKGIQGNVAQIFAPAEGAADESGKRAGSAFAASAAKWMAAGTAVVGVGLKKLFDVGSVFDDLSDTIRVGTGKSGAALAGLETVAKTVATTVPTSFAEAGDIVAGLSQRMGLSGDDLTKVASQYAQAGNILGSAIDIKGTTAAFQAFGLSGNQVSGAMDQLFQVSQATGVGFNELAAAAQAQAPAMKTLGFNFNQTTALIGNLDKAGLNSTQVLAGMGKGLIGLAKAGEEPQKAFQRVTGQIGDLIKSGNTAGALDLASKLFGTKGANQFVAAVQSGAIGAADLGKAVGQSGDTILGVAKETADFGESWTLFKNKALGALEPAGAAVFNFASQKMAALTASFDVLLPKAQTAWGVLRTGDFPGAAAGIGEEDSPLVKSLLFAHEKAAALKPGIQEAWSILSSGDFKGGLGFEEDSPFVNFLFKLRDVGVGTFEKLGGVWDTLKGAAHDLWPAIQSIAGTIGDVMSNLSGAGLSTWDIFLTALQGVASVVKTVLVPVLTWLADFFKNNPAQLYILIGAFTAWKVVTLAISAATKIWAAVQAVLNAVMNMSPIMKIVLVLGLLVAGLTYAWQHSETFRNIVMGVWDVIQNVISFAWNNVIKPVFDAIVVAIHWVIEAFQAVVGAVGAVITWISDAWTAVGAFLARVWEGIKTAAATAWGFIRDYIVGPLKAAWDWITGVFATIVGWIDEHIWTPIKNAVKAAWDAVYSYIIKPIEDAVAWVKTKLNEFLGWVKGIWNDITGVFSSAPPIKVDVAVQTGVEQQALLARLNADTPEGALLRKNRRAAGLDMFGITKKDGGILPGYAPGLDVIPAILSPGEGIMVPELARQVGGARLDMWNKSARSGVQLFAGGGTAGWPASQWPTPLVVPVGAPSAAVASVDMSPLADRMDTLIMLLQQPRVINNEFHGANGPSLAEQLQEYAAVHGVGPFGG